MATTRTSLEDARPSRLPTPRSSMVMDPMSPTSPMTASPLREFARARSPNATPVPVHPTHRMSSSIPSFITRKASGVFAEGPRANSSGSANPSGITAKLSAAAAAATKSPKPTVSRTAQGQTEKPGDTGRRRTVSGVSNASKDSTRSRPAPNQPRSRVHSLASQSSQSLAKPRQEPPASPTKKVAVLPQPESPIQPSPVKPKPRLSGVSKPNGSPHTITSPSRPPHKTPGSRQTSSVFPPISTPSPPLNVSRAPKPSEQKTVQKVPVVVPPPNDVHSTNGSYENDWTPSVGPAISGPASDAYDFSGIPLGSEGLPQFRPEDDEMTMELITEIDDGGELDEDVSFLLYRRYLSKIAEYACFLPDASGLVHSSDDAHQKAHALQTLARGRTDILCFAAPCVTS